MRPLPPLTPTFDAALRDVRADGMDYRLAAALRLGDEPTPDRAAALAALRTLSEDALGPIRAAALAGLGQLGDAASLGRLRRALTDRDAGARQAAVEAAGRLRELGGMDILDEALASERPELRFAALNALADGPVELVRPRLARALGDPDPAVRALAAEGLGALGDAAAGELQAIAGLLVDAELDVARTAALALAALEDPRGVPLLIGALEDPRFCLDAAEALGRLRAQEAREPLAALLARWTLSPSLHAEVAGALCRLDDARGEAGLARVLRAFRPDGRSRAAELAGELGLRALAPELRRLARRPRGADPEIVRQAVARLEALPHSDGASP